MIEDRIIERRQQFLNRFVAVVYKAKKILKKDYLGFNTYSLSDRHCADWEPFDTKEIADEWVTTYSLPSKDDEFFAEIRLIYMSEKRFRPENTNFMQENEIWFDCLVDGDYEPDFRYEKIGDYVLKFFDSIERISDEKCRYADFK